MSIESMIESWNGLAVVSRYEAATAAWIFIALHDATLGTPTGGTRMKIYPQAQDGLRDAMRLAEGMTHKWAAVELSAGGGKGVLCLSRALKADEHRELLRLYGRTINLLQGGFATGRDLGTTGDDMVTIAEVCRHVHGVDRGSGATRDPGGYTAIGVLAAMRAVLRRLQQHGDVSGCTVLVEGVGDVGAPLARALAGAGARLLLSDLDGDRAQRLAAELQATVVPTAETPTTPCDIYAPCAIGATVNKTTIPGLQCKAVCGSANNQLDEEQDAQRLFERGILYAPDYLANGGGALAFGLFARGAGEEQALARLEDIGTWLDEIFAEAAQRNESPLAASRRRVERILAGA